MGATRTPTPEEIHRVITLDAYNAALAQCQAEGQKLIEKDDHDSPTIITVRPGTYQETTFRLGPDNTVLTDEETLNTAVRTQIFGQAWANLKSDTKDMVKAHASRFLGTGRIDDELAPSRTGNNPTNKTVHAMGLAPATLRAIESTSVAVANAVAGGQIRNADAVGSKLLSKMLGNENISLTLSAAGAHSTWNDFNTCMTHKPEIQKAMATNANALITWFRAPHNHQYIETDQKYNQLCEPNADNIIKEARQIFELALDTITNRNSRTEGPEGQRPRLNIPDTSALWNTYCNLSTAAFRRFPPLHTSHVKIAILAHNTGVLPTLTAIRTYIQEKFNTNCRLHQLLTEAMIVESRKRSDHPSKNRTQEALAKQYQAALKLPDAITEELQNSIAHQAANRQPVPEDWDQWLKFLPPSVAHEGTMPKTKKPKAKTRDMSTTDWNGAMDQAVEFLTGEGLEQTTEALTQAVSIKVTDQREITLRTSHQDTPILRIVRLPSGHIQVEGSPFYSNATLTLKHHGNSENNSNITTRGLVNDAARNAVSQILKRHRLDFEEGSQATRQNMLSEAVRRVLGKMPPHTANRLSDQHITRALQKALNRMLNTYHLLHAGAQLDSRSTNEFQYRKMERIPLELYNVCATAAHVIRELNATNPGTLQWALTTGLHSVQDEINHPGQIIALAKRSMAQAGLDKKAWKTATKLDANRIRAITTAVQPHQATAFLNALAQANGPHTPGKLTDKLIADHQRTGSAPVVNALSRLQEDAGTHDLLRANITKMITLICRHPSPEDILREVNDVTDFVRELTRNQHPLRATTWGGLHKASLLWHRTMNHGEADSIWQEILQNQDGHYRAWNSLIGEMTSEHGITVQPLTSEMDLYHESKAMSHCVIRYGNDCAGGRTRVFRLLQQGRHIATGELVRTDGRWHPNQTKAKNNHPATPQAELAMHNLATQYNRAWLNTKSKRTQSWTVEHQPDAMDLELAQAAD